MSEKHWDQEIHERLLAGEVTAPSELVDVVLPLLMKALEKKNPRFRDSELLNDAITDALISYIKAPHQLDPVKLPLTKYLIMSAQRDFQNALAKEKRSKSREFTVENVELLEDGGNKDLRGNEDLFGLGPEREKILQRLMDRFKNPKDLQLLELILDGERATETFARVLEIENLPFGGQQRAVKRHKDRLKKRLERYAKQITRDKKS
jgi:RNA polymerase sigma-70 factor (ECF subfamily)